MKMVLTKDGLLSMTSMAVATVVSGGGVDVSPPSTNTTTLHLLLDRLLLLSPRTWWGFLVATSKNDFTDFDLQSFIKALLIGNLLPAVIILFCLLWNTPSSIPIVSSSFNHHQQSATTTSVHLLLPRFGLLYLLSPIVWKSILDVTKQINLIYQSFIGIWNNRFDCLSSANNSLQQRLSTNRAYTTRRYIVFLPPPPPTPPSQPLSVSTEAEGETKITTPTTPKETAIRTLSSSHDIIDESQQQQRRRRQKAVLFFPGFNVPHVAYSKVASQLSDFGLIVVIVSMEPIRNAATNLGADPSRIRNIIKQVEKQQQQSKTKTNQKKLIEWSLMGHSMGALCAMNMYPKLRRRRHNNKVVINNKLVLWGIAAFHTQATNLSAYNNEIDILKVQATDDEVIQLRKPYQEIFDTYFPSNHTKTIWIKGGNHGGFADYCIKGSAGDEETTDQDNSRERQQLKACLVTADFLID